MRVFPSTLYLIRATLYSYTHSHCYFPCCVVKKWFKKRPSLERPCFYISLQTSLSLSVYLSLPIFHPVTQSLIAILCCIHYDRWQKREASALLVFSISLVNGTPPPLSFY